MVQLEPDVAAGLADDDRALILAGLEPPPALDVAGVAQRLHGEPHPWNLLTTPAGPRFIDFENCARGPIEYDLASVPTRVSRCYRDADQDLVDACRRVVLALVAAHRWHRDDRHPSGRQSGLDYLRALHVGPPWPGLDDVHW